mmetsp:Transcript_42515/g.74627  ORF Transcript_42515/g.74627 Transcript_42515/m.74627 type:complete len:488 (+) Transcript_42515:150-1613(+)
MAIARYAFMCTLLTLCALLKCGSSTEEAGCAEGSGSAGCGWFNQWLHQLYQFVATPEEEIGQYVPDLPFDRLPTPPAPDYGETGHSWAWAAWPGKGSIAETLRPSDEPFLPESERSISCFFIPGTTGLGSKTWNVPFDDREADVQLQFAMATQASVFNHECRMFVPRYRQISLLAYMAPDSNSALTAMYLAYSDVRRAFEKFLEAIGPDTPFIIAGHSQGSLHGKRLLLEVVESDAALAKRMVAAYLIGQHIQQGFVHRLNHTKAATAGGQINVVLGYDTLPADADMSLRRLNTQSASEAAKSIPYLEIDTDVIVTNPVDWTEGKHLGMALPSPTGIKKFSLNASFVNTISIDKQLGFLRCGRPTQHWPADAKEKLPDWLFILASDKDLHSLDILIWYFNIRANVAQQVKSYRRMVNSRNVEQLNHSTFGNGSTSWKEYLSGPIRQCDTKIRLGTEPSGPDRQKVTPICRSTFGQQSYVCSVPWSFL